jgi:hypothetical protein
MSPRRSISNSSYQSLRCWLDKLQGSVDRNPRSEGPLHDHEPPLGGTNGHNYTSEHWGTPTNYPVGGDSILVRQAPYIAHDHILGRAHRVTTGHSDIGGSFSPLFERAWVFQERLLAPRTIVFHHEELVWECAKATWCECGEINSSSTPSAIGYDELYLKGRLTRLNFNADGIVYSKEHMFSFWMDAVERYSLLSLTKESDRLPALAGLAQRLSKRFSCRYLAGMWEEDLARNLLWSRDPWRETRSCNDLSDYCTPTWSWTFIRLRTTSNNFKSFIRYDYTQDYFFQNRL